MEKEEVQWSGCCQSWGPGSVPTSLSEPTVALRLFPQEGARGKPALNLSSPCFPTLPGARLELTYVQGPSTVAEPMLICSMPTRMSVVEAAEAYAWVPTTPAGRRQKAGEEVQGEAEGRSKWQEIWERE